MAVKPSDLPEWATDAGANIVEPNTAKKEQGWLTNEQPPSGFFNWWKNKVFQWTQYVDELETTQGLSWTLLQQFTQGIGLGGNPASGIARSNRLEAKNTPKVWALFRTGQNPVILDGYNLAALNPISYGALTVNIAFGSIFSSVNYCAVLSLDDNSGIIRVDTIQKSNNSIQLRLVDTSNTTILDPQNFAATINLVIFGPQP